MTECTCNAPKRRGEIRNAAGALQAVFDLDCHEHGIKVVADKPMRKVFKLQWMTREQLLGIRTLTAARVKQKHPDGKHALIEYVDWEFETTEEDPHGQGDTAQAAE
jgi:hypothetical protein